MKPMFRIALLCVVLLSAANAQDFKFSGQLRERSEFDTKLLTPGQSSDVFHILRTRLRADVTMNPDVLVRVEFQDARVYGQKATALNTGSPAFDLRQGYVEVQNILETPLGLRLGRTELAYGNQRLLGAIDWNLFGYSFDAGILKAAFGDVSVDVIGAALARNVNPVPGYNRDVILTGTWIAWKPSEVKSTVQGFLLFDNPKDSKLRQNRYTAGLYANGVYGGFDFAVDGVYQFGEYITARSTLDIGASMVCVKAGYTFKELSNLRIGAGFDMLSGTDLNDSTKYGTFNTLYGSNHGKYGHMDYFGNMPLTTQELGLQNICLELSVKPSATFAAFVELHLFSTVIDPKDLVPAGTSTTRNIGKELDVWCSWKLADALNMQGGVSWFDFETDRYLYRGRKTTNWAYLQTTVNF